jgi:O-antigen ligase
VINYVLPILFFSITTFSLSVTTLFRSGILVLLALLILIIKPVKFGNYKVISILFSIIIVMYTASFIVNDQSYVNFLIGTFGRNVGILALIGLFLLVLESADNFAHSSQKLINSLYLLLGLSNLYGVIQSLGIDPINWEKGAGIAITIGNPNFYSALLGMLSIIPLYSYFNANKKYKYLHLFLYLSTFIQIIITDSSQGFVLFITNILLFVLLKFQNVLLNKIKIVLLLFSAFSCALIVILLTNLQYILNYINASFQFQSRIDHWALGLRIWKDHFLFGVGIENLTNFSGQYRDQAMREWGQYTLPDKSHNTFIDYFVTGGFIVGLCWILFVVIIFAKSFKILRTTSDLKNFNHVHTLFCVWTTWILQTTFSPDHLVLAACGMMAAGALLGNANKAKSRESKESAK